MLDSYANCFDSSLTKDAESFLGAELAGQRAEYIETSNISSPRLVKGQRACGDLESMAGNSVVEYSITDGEASSVGMRTEECRNPALMLDVVDRAKLRVGCYRSAVEKPWSFSSFTIPVKLR